MDGDKILYNLRTELTFCIREFYKAIKKKKDYSLSVFIYEFFCPQDYLLAKDDSVRLMRNINSNPVVCKFSNKEQKLNDVYDLIIKNDTKSRILTLKILIHNRLNELLLVGRKSTFNIDINEINIPNCIIFQRQDSGYHSNRTSESENNDQDTQYNQPSQNLQLTKIMTNEEKFWQQMSEEKFPTTYYDIALKLLLRNNENINLSNETTEQSDDLDEYLNSIFHNLNEVICNIYDNYIEELKEESWIGDGYYKKEASSLNK